jgi:TRAP-type transport system periplasmic protein
MDFKHFNYVCILSFLIIFSSTIFINALEDKNKAKIVLKVGTPFKQGHILTDTAEKFKELIEKDSNGKISVQIEAGIDTEENVNTRCSKGDLDIQINGGRPLEVFSPQYFFFNAPYVIKDYDHFQKVWKGALGKKSQDLILKNGNMNSLSTVFRGYRQMTSKKALNGPDDIAGLKLRLPVVTTWIKIWESVGAKPVAITLPNLYQSLKDASADASEGDLTQIQSFKLNEVQSYVTVTNHLCAVGWALINSDSYKKLTASDKKLLNVCMQKACDFATKKTNDNDTQRLKDLEKTGMKIVYPDADAIRTKAKPAIEELFKTEWPVTTWAEVLK